MRKFTFVFSVLVLVSMLLAACGGQETSTTAPSTDLPATDEPTMEATEEPAGTQTGEPTGEGTAVGGIPVTGEDDPSRLSNQLDYNVWNQNGEQIGEVNDMVVDLENTRISYVIVGTGGFLEIGEKVIFVPRDSLQLQTEGGDMTGGEQYAFILQVDQATFENAPATDPNVVLPALGEPAGDWDADIRNLWEGGAPGASATGTPEADAVATAGTDTSATAMPAGAGTPGETEMTTGDLQGVILASELLGSTITVTADGQVTGGADQGQALGTGTPEVMPTAQSTDSAGVATAQPGITETPGAAAGTGIEGQAADATVDDVIVDVDTGDIRYLVLNSTFDDGDRWIPVPLSGFQWDATNGSLALNVDQAMLADAPFFLDGQYPDMMAEGWDSDYSAYWQ